MFAALCFLIVVLLFCLYKRVFPAENTPSISSMLPDGWPREAYHLLRHKSTPLQIRDSKETAMHRRPRAWANTDWWESEFWTIPIATYRRTFTAIALLAFCFGLYLLIVPRSICCPVEMQLPEERDPRYANYRPTPPFTCSTEFNWPKLYRLLGLNQ